MKQAFRVEDGAYGSRVVVTSSWSPGITKYIQDNDVKELYLNYAWGWKGNDLAFLSELTALEAFFILDWAIRDISPIHFLRRLKFMHVSTYCDTKIDFAHFPDLEECHLEWRRGAESLFQCRTLKNLWLNSYSGTSSARPEFIMEVRGSGFISSSKVGVT